MSSKVSTTWSEKVPLFSGILTKLSARRRYKKKKNPTKWDQMLIDSLDNTNKLKEIQKIFKSTIITKTLASFVVYNSYMY